MIITKIERQKKNTNKFNLFVDSQYYGSFSYEIILDYHFVDNQIVKEEALKAALADQEKRNAYEKSLNILSYRMNSEMELKRKLKEHYTEVAINETVLKLKKFKFLDDNKFSELWLKERKDGRGRRLLQAELAKKGINRDIIKKNLENLSREEEVISAEKLLEKRFKGEIDPKKALQYLANRGFDYEISKKALQQDK